MLIWEYNDGTFGPSPLVTNRSDTTGSNIDATLDNRKDQGTGNGKRTESEGTTPASSTGASASDRSPRDEGWRRKGHSQR